MFISRNCSCTQGRSIECQRSGGLVTSAGHMDGLGCHCRAAGSRGRHAGYWTEYSPLRGRCPSAGTVCCGCIGRNSCWSAWFWHSCNTPMILASAVRRMAADYRQCKIQRLWLGEPGAGARKGSSATVPLGHPGLNQL